MEKLKKIGELLRTQDNRITDAPIFIVEQKIRDYGYSPEYSDDYEWYNHNDSCEAEEGEKGAEKVFYKDRWVFVTACFTEQGCKDYLRINGHNLNEPRIFAAGSYRNEEFRAIRAFIMAL